MSSIDLFKNSMSFKGNSLTVGDTVIVVSSISYLSFSNESKTQKNPFPASIPILIFFGILTLVVAVLGQIWWIGLFSIACLGGAVYNYKNYKPTTHHSKFALAIKINNGETFYITSPSRQIVEDMTQLTGDYIGNNRNMIGNNQLVMQINKNDNNILEVNNNYDNRTENNISGGNFNTVSGNVYNEPEGVHSHYSEKDTDRNSDKPSESKTLETLTEKD